MRFTLNTARRRAFFTGFAQQDGIVLRARATSFCVQAIDAKLSFWDFANQGRYTGAISELKRAINLHAHCENEPDQKSVSIFGKSVIKYRKVLLLVSYSYNKSLNVNTMRGKVRVRSPKATLLKLFPALSFHMNYASQPSESKLFHTYFAIGAN